VYYNNKGTLSTQFNIGGPSGSALYSGNGTPSVGTGNNGDLFLSQNTNNLNIKISGSWFNITNSNAITIGGLSQGTNDVILSNGTNWTSAQLSLNNLSGVITSSLTTGNILYFNGTNFVNSAPNSTSGVQPYSANLATIAALSQTNHDVIVSNGTTWTTRELALDTDLSDVIIGTLANGNHLRYNGTSWVNQVETTEVIFTSASAQTDIKMWIGSAASNTNGSFTASLTSAGFTTVISASVTAFENTATIGSVPLASIATLSTTSITGSVVTSKSTTVGIGGGTVAGLQFAGTSASVYIQVWGT